MHIVSGDKLAELRQITREKAEKGEFSQDVYFNQDDYKGVYEERWRNQYKFLFDSFGVTREDNDGRAKVTMKNFQFYDAPHIAFLFVPKVADNLASATGDMGMLVQNMMLSLTARGYGSVPMLASALFAKDIKQFLGVSDDYQLYFGLAFGKPDWQAEVNKGHLGRADVSEIVTFHG